VESCISQHQLLALPKTRCVPNHSPKAALGGAQHLSIEQHSSLSPQTQHTHTYIHTPYTGAGGALELGGQQLPMSINIILNLTPHTPVTLVQVVLWNLATKDCLHLCP